MTLRYSAPIVITSALMLLLTGCATPSGADASPDAPASWNTTVPAPPTGEVIAQGTVLDKDGAELCLGAIAESYPPQCSGIPITNWTWDRLDGSETASGVTWGAYAVTGTYDGEEFTVSGDPIMLALHDPMMAEDPTGGEAGKGDEQTHAAVSDELMAGLGDQVLSTYPDNGWLWVDVVWDDGTWQAAADEEYGPDVVIIRSALRPVEG